MSGAGPAGVGNNRVMSATGGTLHSWPDELRHLATLDEAAVATDLQGRIKHANRSALRLFGNAGLDLEGADVNETLFAEHDRAAMARVAGQVAGGAPWTGRLDLVRPDGTPGTSEVGCWPYHASGDQAGLLYLLTDPGSEQALLRQSRRLGDRIARVARATAELTMAEDVGRVTEIVVTHTADAVGATMASLTLRVGDDELELLGLRGGREGDAQRYAKYSIHQRTPASDAIRTERPVVVIGSDAMGAAYPDIDDTGLGERSVVCLPMRVPGRTIGAVGLSFPGRRRLDAAELEFFEIMADTCAQALERIRVRAESAAQSARLRFLADASSELSTSLDYEATLAAVAKLSVPDFADWCTIDVVEDGRLHTLAIEHVDPAKVELARRLQERYPSDPDAQHGAWHVLRTGVSEHLPEISEDILEAGAVDEEHLALMRELKLRSAVVVPLSARGRVLGVMTWVSAESDRRYEASDVAFAEDLAGRAGVAIDNAQLHSQILETAVRLQHAVLPERLPEVEPWQLASYYSPSGRTEVGGDFYDAVPLGDGRLALFVGDVMGRGVTAAAAMAQMRSAVRAYLAVDPRPDQVMSKLGMMFDRYAMDQLVTLVYAVADPTRNEIVIANAGHPPPVILRASGSVEQFALAEGAPLGTGSREAGLVVTLPFHEGDTFLAFTDGLIERREEDIDVGQGRVTSALPILAEDDLASALNQLVGQVRDRDRDDDVAALALRWRRSSE